MCIRDSAYRFIEGLDVTQLHVFSYSERPGTQALKIEYVVSPEAVSYTHLDVYKRQNQIFNSALSRRKEEKILPFQKKWY